MPTYHVQQTWRARRPKTVVSHYLENPRKPPENEFAKDWSKSNAILKRCVLCDYKEKEKKFGGGAPRTWRNFISKLKYSTIEFKIIFFHRNEFLTIISKKKRSDS